jgi:molecular chaperone DnaJ
MAKRDYYEVLGVSKGADKSAIKKAYRKLAKEKHPDRNKAADAEAQFKEVQEAYEVLSDERKRSAYDQYGHAATQGFGGGGTSGYGGFGGAGGFGGFGADSGFSNEDLSDIFSQFFGNGFGGFGRAGGASAASGTRGADIEATLTIDFDEAVFGKYKTISYMRKTTCDGCNGTGAASAKAYKTCETCKGHGQVTRIQQTFLGSIQTTAPCPTCGGRGKNITEFCKKCAGEGRVEKEEDFRIKIPPGIPDGVTLRFASKGNAGKNGGNFGDLYITIEVEAHPTLERRGNDIYTTASIDPTLAALGGEIEIDSVRGKIDLKIPPGTQPGKIFRLSDKGGPKFKGEGNGDQYVQIDVAIPEKLSRKQRDLWEQLAAIKDEKPGIFG